VLLTTTLERGCRARHGQRGDDELSFWEKNIQELMIDDMQRKII